MKKFEWMKMCFDLPAAELLVCMSDKDFFLVSVPPSKELVKFYKIVMCNFF